jgi:thiamine biosynthesis protein ThiS
MQIKVNNQSQAIAAGTTIAQLIEQLELNPSRIAVEHNRLILTPEQFNATILQADDSVEIVNFVGGG